MTADIDRAGAEVRATARDAPVTIRRIQMHAFRQPIAVPVATSFGIMSERPAVFVRLEDEDGCFGWGEVFANWPAAGAEHRCNLVARDLADLIVGQSFSHAGDLFARLDRATRIRALQSGEYGPFRQAIAGLDTALWDLFARRACLPVARYIRQDAPRFVPAYASGIHIDVAEKEISNARTAGFKNFKVKVGFNATDAARVRSVAEGLPREEALMADANQAWDVDGAIDFLRDVSKSKLAWMEEPIIASAQVRDWVLLAAATDVPIAAGENLAGFQEFDAALSAGAISIFQPDLAKWGGITGCLAVARSVVAKGRHYCPHFLGGGIGLAASAHLLAAVGGDGVLEVDVNPNALRDAFGAVSTMVNDGHWPIAPAPGFGIETLPGEIAQYETLKLDCI